MNRSEKIQKTEELREVFEKAEGFFIADFKGLAVSQLTSLRFELKKAGAEFRVVKNRLALKALKPETADQLSAKFDEMTGVAISYRDVAAGAKTVSSFAKANEKFKLRAGYVEGRLINVAEIKALSELPSREELLAKLLGTWNAVPSSFVRVLNAIPSGWVNLLDAMKRKKEGS
jgi:large subunit ribosomal protein L10